MLAGASAYPRTLDFGALKEAADSVGAVMIVDIAHIAGLVAVGLHPTPVPLADAVTTTTHKTLRGPRSGMIPGDPEKPFVTSGLRLSAPDDAAVAEKVRGEVKNLCKQFPLYRRRISRAASPR